MSDPEFIAAMAEKKEKEKEKKAKKTRVRRTINGVGTFRHRCYWGRPTKVGWLVQLTFRCDLYDMPTSFHWNDRDLDGVQRYIDALVAGRTTEARIIEDTGLVLDLKYQMHDPNTKPIMVQVKDFVDFLLLRGHIELPAHRRILFVTSVKYHAFVPAEFIAAVSQLPGLEFLQRHTDGWEPGRPADFDKLGLKAEEVTTNLGITHPQHTALALARPDEIAGAAPTLAPSPLPASEAPPSSASIALEVPPAESEITRKAREKHFELITAVKPRDGRTYFVRRLSTYGGQLLWAGTSFQFEGPWIEYARENALLIGLGIEP
jgi:hypothetical protein